MDKPPEREKSSMRAWRIFVIGTFMLISIGICLTFLGDKGHFLKWLAGHRNTVLDYYFYHVTKLGEEAGFFIIGIILWLRSWRKMVMIALLGGIVTLASYLLKEFFEQERPSIYLKRIGWEGPLDVLDYQLLSGHASFPSGHSMAAWALFTLTAVLIRKTWVSLLCLFMAVSVSVSRVYLMAHFLRDVVGGAALGFSLGFAMFVIYDNWMKKNRLLQEFARVKETTKT
jgi:membrane-associated phospholipid phosphatase